MTHRHSRLWWVAGCFAVAAAAATSITQTAVVAAARGPAAATAAAWTPAGVAEPAGISGRERAVLLITGNRVLANPAARGPVSGGVIPGNARGLNGSMLALSLGGQAYEIPAAALPYLGRGLDPGLFRLGALLSEERAGRLPVRIGYRGTLPALPGVTITGHGGGSARGYLTATSARAFGSALDRQYLADHARGSYGTDGMFGGGVSIALAGTAAPSRPRTTPDFPMATLTVTGTNSAGMPDTGDEVAVINADNSNRFSDPNAIFSFFDNGTAKFSVPIGHYWAIADFPDVARGGTTTPRVDVLTEFNVAGATTVSTSARAATSKIMMVTPRPARVAETDFEVLRGGRSGPPVSIGLSGTSTIWVSPVSTPPTIGSLHASATQVLYSPRGKRVPYQYALEYGDPPGIISAQRYVVRPEDVATAMESYYQAQRSTIFWVLFGERPGGFGLVELLGALTAPGRNVLYAGGNLPSLTWQRSYVSYFALRNNAWNGGQNQGFASLPHGALLAERWGGYPLHPDANANLAPANRDNLTQPSATRSGNSLRLDITPFTDNQPGNYGLGFVRRLSARSTGRYEVDQDGRKIAGGNAVSGIGGFPNPDFSTHVALSPKPSVIRVMLTAAVVGRHFKLSTSSRTVWTWRSAYQQPARLPQGWFCYRDPVTNVPSPDHNCKVQPMMTLEYDVHAMALDGSVRAGRQLVGITVGHLQLAPAARITRARVWVSFDNGRAWHHASVTRAGVGKFAAVFTAPAGAFVMLRTSAADAAGGSITETIARAYRIGS